MTDLRKLYHELELLPLSEYDPVRFELWQGFRIEAERWLEKNGIDYIIEDSKKYLGSYVVTVHRPYLEDFSQKFKRPFFRAKKMGCS